VAHPCSVWRTYINDESGLFKCHHGKCGAVGNFYTLRKHLGDLPAADPYVPVAVAKKRHTAELLSFEVALEVDEDAKSYLASREIDMATAKAWHFGVKTDEHGVKWLMIPYLVNDVVGDIKYRSLPPAPKQFHRLKGGDSILFGGHQLADAQGRSTLYLVEGELDCVTLWQHGYWPAVSTTTGAGSFKVAWYDAIVAFDPKEIVICYDSDTAGQKGAEALLKKFEDRIVKNIVLPEAKDANEYFTTHSNADFDALLAAARPPELENAKSMTTVLNMLQEQLWFSANAFDGVPSMFDEVNTMIAGGYWRGQLVTISGSSGTGKNELRVAGVVDDGEARPSRVSALPGDAGSDDDAEDHREGIRRSDDADHGSARAEVPCRP
jgi:twinkle protein